MKNLFIVGGNGLAREVYMHITLHPNYGKEITFGGFLGHAGYGHTVDYKGLQHLYKGEVADYPLGKDDYCIIGIGAPQLRQKIYTDLKAQGAQLYNFASKGCTFGPGFHMGEGNLMIESFFAVDVSIGNGNLFNHSVALGHDCSIGDFNFFAPCTHCLGGVKVGNHNNIAVNAVCLPNSKVGSHNQIAPLSVLYKGCKSSGVYAGNPAIKVGTVE